MTIFTAMTMTRALMFTSDSKTVVDFPLSFKECEGKTIGHQVISRFVGASLYVPSLLISTTLSVYRNQHLGDFHASIQKSNNQIFSSKEPAKGAADLNNTNPLTSSVSINSGNVDSNVKNISALPPESSLIEPYAAHQPTDNLLTLSTPSSKNTERDFLSSQSARKASDVSKKEEFVFMPSQLDQLDELDPNEELDQVDEKISTNEVFKPAYWISRTGTMAQKIAHKSTT